MTERLIDLRSDTVTRPTDAMRQAMARAEVGDDVYGEDPTVNALEARVAELLGKQAALFVTSGTQGNQVAIRTHTEPGDEVILDAAGHSFHFEAGATAALSGVQVHVIPTRTGIFNADDVTERVRTPNVHAPKTRLVVAENTSNFGGGRVWPLEILQDVARTAWGYQLKVHLDGARLMNAVVASGVSAREFAACADSVSLCLSKGLGAPVGSVLAGERAFIERARRFRKQFGGGLRQAGILAAAGLYALDHHVDRLADDHAHAASLARGLADIPGVQVGEVETNIVFFDLEPGLELNAAALAALLRERGVLVSETGLRRLRAVTHLDVSADDVDRALEAIREILRT